MSANTKPAENTFVKNKLLVLSQLFYPELVSTGQTITELCEKLSDMGVDIEVLCGPPTLTDNTSDFPRNIEYHGIRIKRVWGTRFPKLNLIGRILNQVSYACSTFFVLLFHRTDRPILVITNPPFLAVICALLKRIKHLKYIYLVFDVYPETVINLGLLGEKSFLARIWDLSNRFVFTKADNLVVIGRCMRSIIAKKLDADLARKIELIHVWCDDSLIQSVSCSAENPYIREWRLENKFVLSYSGNMGRFHDMETIIETARILKDYHDIVFLFIGEGFKKQTTMTFAKENQLENCQFHTYVPRKDLGYSLAAADIGLVSLLKGQEGLSVPSKTYGLLSAGLPVIAVMSPDSEIALMLKEENCGEVVNCGDSRRLAEIILEFYRNREKLSEMSNNARIAIKNKYNLAKAAEKYYAIIQKLNNI